MNLKNFSFLLLFTALFWTNINISLCQVDINCDISVSGIIIGSLKAQKFLNQNEEKYLIQSHVSFWFFGKIYVDYNLETKFLNGHFYNSNSKTKTNKGDFFSVIQWNKDHYTVNTTSYKFKNNSSINTLLFYSTAKLYFEEPVNEVNFLAENFGLVSSITKKGDYYEVNVNGNINKFYYNNGVFEKAVMQSPIKNYVVQKR